MKLSREQEKVVALCESGKSIFLTGSAGVGKSHALRCIIEAMKKKYGNRKNIVCVTASTGNAAEPLPGGTTLHSFASIGLGKSPLGETLEKLGKNKKATARWLAVRVLVVDEISMIDPDYFEFLNQVAKAVRHSDKPFGGIQLILCGDFAQLPPVGSQGRYAFDTKAWAEAIPMENCVELKHIFRQSEQRFVNLLQNARKGIVTDDDDQMWRSRLRLALKLENGLLPTKLDTHRQRVDQINAAELAKLPGTLRHYNAKDFGSSENLDRHCLAPKNLVLKLGAQVLLLKNLNPPILVNGSKGRVVDFGEDANKEMCPWVLFENGSKVLISPAQWKIEQNHQVVACRTQVPLCLAWAFSVHKSQGMTLDKVEIDISRSFDVGQAYVALSRCSSWDGLSLTGYNRHVIHADPKVLAFYEKIDSHSPSECEPSKKKLKNNEEGLE